MLLVLLVVRPVLVVVLLLASLLLLGGRAAHGAIEWLLRECVGELGPPRVLRSRRQRAPRMTEAGERGAAHGFVIAGVGNHLASPASGERRVRR